MNPKYFATFTTLVLATGLSQSATQAQAKELILNSTFNPVFVQRSPQRSHLQTDIAVFSRGREGNVLLSQKKNPPPPRPSPPGGSRAKSC